MDRERLERFLAALGRAAKGPGAVYLTGGASAVLVGWRPSTVDVDLRLDPEPAGAFEAIARLKDELGLNVELASPADFLPELPGWRERSPFVLRAGPVDVFHYDFEAQALAKLERGHARDLADVEAMVAAGLVAPARLHARLSAIAPALVRFPGVDPQALAAKVAAFVERQGPATPPEARP